MTVVVLSDGSVRRGCKSGYAYSARQNGVVVAEGSGVFAQTTPSICMEVITTCISEAIAWCMLMPSSSQT